MSKTLVYFEWPNNTLSTVLPVKEWHPFFDSHSNLRAIVHPGTQISWTIEALDSECRPLTTFGNLENLALTSKVMMTGSWAKLSPRLTRLSIYWDDVMYAFTGFVPLANTLGPTLRSLHFKFDYSSAWQLQSLSQTAVKHFPHLEELYISSQPNS
ncbi:hypothetical protein BKA70DRAFT_1417168 [Coprinopsis sp. MPI-PUGE-AT-0042]|nr:hypothetical protein BKA70DRAFT_1417168 [Coprinopsis sp. MPI-PUGE-AT-0042]